jgi:hypothetical protein
MFDAQCLYKYISFFYKWSYRARAGKPGDDNITAFITFCKSLINLIFLLLEKIFC